MNLVEIRLDNAKRKTYKINKNGYLYLYQDILSSYLLESGKIYIALLRNPIEVLLVKYAGERKTYSGIKLIKDTENIFHFNLRRLMSELSKPLPCKCKVDIYDDAEYKGIKITFINK